MNRPEPTDATRSLAGRADEHLHVIRAAMERAGSFTAVPGWGGVAMGVVALAAAWFANAAADPGAWLRIWLGAAVLGFAIGAATTVGKARRSGVPLLGGVSRRFFLALAAPIAVGAALTAALAAREMTALLPGVWLLLYGSAVLTAGAQSIPLIPTLGFSFLAIGAIALASPAAWGDAFLALGFGGLQIGFGLVIARRHGG
ncbi:MAG TPA: hypothetical protein VFU59_03705 [Candidatus Eisenbacteria bacterium]|nr:hypothetical protein [Candidatus Eisenbacteria bacterium]